MTDFSDDDRRYMRMALALGRRGLGRTWPNPSVGAVIVKDGTIVSRGWTQPGGRPHAEVDAIKRSKRTARGATLYVTLEPCSHHGQSPPCADAVIAAGIVRVVCAIEDPNPLVAGQGYARLRERKIIVETGLLAEEATQLHAGHIRRMRDARPHVLLKLALSSDGKVGGAGRRPTPITGDEAQARMFLQRARSDAILVGKGTVLADNPQLTARLPGLEAQSPVRIVLNTSLSLPLASAVVATARDTATWIVGGSDASAMAEDVLRSRGVEVLRAPADNGRLDPLGLLKVLAERGITSVMVEGGPMVAASFAQAGVVDELMLLHGAKPIGEDGIAPLEGMPLDALTSTLSQVGDEMIGADRLVHYRRA